MIKNPTGFFSYAREDDELADGRLSEMRRRLSSELTVQMGRRFDIFQDTRTIICGQPWVERIDDSLDTAAILICVMTPSFFYSGACRREVEVFAQRESKLGRRDLIVPVYHIHCPLLHDASLRKDDPVAQLLSERQWADWRGSRFQPLHSRKSKEMFADLASGILGTLDTLSPVEGSDPAAGAIQRA